VVDFGAGDGSRHKSSPRLEKNIGFAMLPIEHSDMGNKFEVETQHGRTWAVTVPRPFGDHARALGFCPAVSRLPCGRRNVGARSASRPEA